jgi:hypothetical protein
MKKMTYIFNLVVIAVFTQVFAADNTNQGVKVFISPAEEAAQVKADDYSRANKYLYTLICVICCKNLGKYSNNY